MQTHVLDGGRRRVIAAVSVAPVFVGCVARRDTWLKPDRLVEVSSYGVTVRQPEVVSISAAAPRSQGEEDRRRAQEWVHNFARPNGGQMVSGLLVSTAMNLRAQIAKYPGLIRVGVESPNPRNPDPIFLRQLPKDGLTHVIEITPSEYRTSLYSSVGTGYYKVSVSDVRSGQFVAYFGMDSPSFDYRDDASVSRAAIELQEKLFTYLREHLKFPAAK